jgi:alkylation response protein AidB-like acyl-CoA dehydrogenase
MSAANTARTFVNDVVRPSLDEWDSAARYPRAAVAGSGLTGMFVARERGGLGLTYTEAIDVFEELGRGDGSLAFSISMHNAVAAAVNGAGTGEVLEKWGPALTSGAALGCFSLTEPQAGSDATAIVTRGLPEGDTWRLTGRKAWVTLGGVADVYAVVAKTSDEPGYKDVAMFVVDGSAPGVSFTAPYRKAASDFLPITEMVLESAPAHLLVPPGVGMKAALGAIDVARFDIAAISCGMLAEALDIAVDYAGRRQTFGKPIIAHQGLSWMLADVATDLEAARGLVRRAAETLGTSEGAVNTAHAKRFAPDALVRGAAVCSEVLGAYGWLHDYSIARILAVATMMSVVDGSAEVQKMVIARALAARAKG